jgi:chlorophyllase
MGPLLRFGIICLLNGLAHQAHAAFVKELIIKTKDGVKVDTLVIYPEQSSAQELGVVVMNHGFMMSSVYYRTILAEIAASGFVVVAPQNMTPGGMPMGKPSTAVEAKSTVQVINWLSDRLSGFVSQPVDWNKLALVNHSRGSKVAWTMLHQDMVNVKAVAAIDPVDGTHDGTELSTQGMQLKIPALIIGSGLGGQKKFGQACAPTKVNYNLFWSTVSASPSWLFVVNDYGHLDILDDNIHCGLACSLCATASTSFSRHALRSWMGSTIGAFFRGIVHGDEGSLEALKNNPMNLSLTQTLR